MKKLPESDFVLANDFVPIGYGWIETYYAMEWAVDKVIKT